MGYSLHMLDSHNDMVDSFYSYSIADSEESLSIGNAARARPVIGNIRGFGIRRNFSNKPPKRMFYIGISYLISTFCFGILSMIVPALNPEIDDSSIIMFDNLPSLYIVVFLAAFTFAQLSFTFGAYHAAKAVYEYWNDNL